VRHYTAAVQWRAYVFDAVVACTLASYPSAELAVLSFQELRQETYITWTHNVTAHAVVLAVRAYSVQTCAWGGPVLQVMYKRASQDAAFRARELPICRECDMAP
jgi:hypothetical protein